MRVAPTPVVVVSAEAGPGAAGARVLGARARRDRGAREAARRRRGAVRAGGGGDPRRGPRRRRAEARHAAPRRTLRPSAVRAAPGRRSRRARALRARRDRACSGSRVDRRAGGARPDPARAAARLPAPILVVQHIAHGFEAGLVHWLASGDARSREARGGRRAAPARAPCTSRPTGTTSSPAGGRVSARRTARRARVPPVRHDAARVARARVRGAGAAGLVLSGMGDDGAAGLGSVRDARRLDGCAGPGDLRRVRHAARRDRARAPRAHTLELDEIAPALLRLAAACRPAA